MLRLESIFIPVHRWYGGDVATAHVVYVIILSIIVVSIQIKNKIKKHTKARDATQCISSPLLSPVVVMDSIHSCPITKHSLV